MVKKKLSKNTIMLAITFFVIAIFLPVNNSLAEKIDIKNYIEKIKTSIDIRKSVIMATLPEGEFKKFLNTAVKLEKSTSDITYGILTISALNEMELIDLVMSQRYKIEAREYFNKILDERLNIVDHCVNLSYDIQTILTSGSITEPTTAMALSTFQITDKIINIFIAFENIKMMKVYDGLWVYFDARNGGETHNSAWEDAKLVMNWAAKTYFGKARSENNKELENQFSLLYNEWGPHVSIKGVDENYKEKIKEGLRNDLTYALNKYNLIEKEQNQPTFQNKTKLVIENIKEEVKKIKGNVNGLAQRATEIVQEKAAKLAQNKKQDSQATISSKKIKQRADQALSSQLEKNIDKSVEVIKKTENNKEIQEETNKNPGKIIEKVEKDEEVTNKKENQEMTPEEEQEIFDEIIEKVDILEQKVMALVEKRKKTTVELAKKNIAQDKNQEKVEKIEKTEEIEKEIEKTEEIEEKKTEKTTFCKISSNNSPKQNKVILNEIAWMGTKKSGYNEWIELKNISNKEINLNKWQIINKEEKIKIIIENDIILQPNNFVLLERTDDNSVENIEADILYTGPLKNSNEALYLFNKDCELQDKVSASPDWIEGNNSSKRTMERKSDLGWQTSDKTEGTPKKDNSSGYRPPSSSGGSSSSQKEEKIEKSEEKETIKLFKILITEVQIETASSTKDDFIEIYNPNPEEVNLSQYSIQKSYAAGDTIYKKNFEKENKIPAKGYFLILNADSTNQNPLNLANMTHKSFELAQNNTIYLVRNQEKVKDPNDSDIIDMVGFRTDLIEFEELPAETTPALNPPAGSSLNRTYSTTTESYVDTDNNYEDFYIQNPSPGAKNKEEIIESEESNQKDIIENKITASFTYSPQNPTKDKEILFNASSSSSTSEIIDYNWDFGDGNSTTTNQATTTYSFNSQDNFPISLIVTDDNGVISTATTTINVVKESKINASFTYGPKKPTNNQEIFFNASSSSSTSEIINYEWSFGNNYSTTTSQATTTHSFSSSGDFLITLLVTNNNGATNTATTTINVAEKTQSLRMLITEVQIENASSTTNDFIEIYNNSSSTVDLNGYQIKKRNSNGTESSIILFSNNETIPPKDHLIWANSNFKEIEANATRTSTIASNNSIALFDTKDNIVDAVGWATSTNPFVENHVFTENPSGEQSLSRKYSTSTESYIDTDNNSQDFALQYPTPGEKNIVERENKEKEEEKQENQIFASFSYNPQNPYEKEEIFFNASSSSSTSEIINYSWNFGDGNTTNTNQATTTYLYTSPDNFLVTLLTTNKDGATSTATTTVNVAKEKPAATVLINEIAWMGTKANSADEWIELYNATNSDIDLNGWSLSWEGTSIEFSTSTASTTIIKANSYYLIERTDNQTTNIPADLTTSFSSSLNNEGEKIELRDNNNQLIDRVDCSEGWLAGIASPQYRTMERKSLTNEWETNNLIIKNGLDIKENNINGTPKQQNSISFSPTPLTEITFDDNITEITLTKQYDPYLVQKDLTIPTNKKLKIEEGVIIKLEENRQITVRGDMETPKSNKSIVFTSWRDDEYGGDTNQDGPSIGEPGDWEQIYFQNSENSHLNNIIVKYGGRLFPDSASFTDDSLLSPLHIEQGNVRIENATITHALLRGVWLQNTSSILKNVIFNNITESPTTRKAAGLFIKGGKPTIQNCNFKNNTIGLEVKSASPTIENCSFDNNSIGIHLNNDFSKIRNNSFQNHKNPIFATLSSSAEFSNNTAQNNNLNGIVLSPYQNEIKKSITWTADLPYILGSKIEIKSGNILTIKPGTIVKIKSGRKIYVYGKILAQGTPENKIIFTSLTDDNSGGDTQENGEIEAGHWNNWMGLYFYSSGSILENTIIKHGGTGHKIKIAALNIQDGIDITISDSIIKQNYYGCSLTPIPDDSKEDYCNNLKTIIEKLKTNNTFCSNKKDTYPTCNIVTGPECE